MRSVDECKEVLELAKGEAEAIIPSEIIDDTIQHLTDYQKLECEMSWCRNPEGMGR